jgi:hypothetical protein
MNVFDSDEIHIVLCVPMTNVQFDRGYQWNVGKQTLSMLMVTDLAEAAVNICEILTNVQRNRVNTFISSYLHISQNRNIHLNVALVKCFICLHIKISFQVPTLR